MNYLKYALGEIILVVVGILIALQINNWNVDQQAAKREKLILKEFKTSIEKDLQNFDGFYNWRLERKKSGLDSLFYYMKTNATIDDSLFKKFYEMMSMNILLSHDDGPYDALKSVGLDHIRNDSLRTAINRTYNLLPKIEIFAHGRDAEKYVVIMELENKVSNIKTFHNQDDQILPEYEIKVDHILTNQDFLRLYNLQLNRYNTYTYRLEQMKSALNELKVQIDQELKK